MKSKFTIFLSSLLVLLSPAFALAAFDDVSLITDSALISISSVNLTVQGGNGASVEQIVVNSDSFVPTMPANSYFKVKSTDRRKFTIDPVGSLKITTTCTDTESTLELDNPSSGPSVAPSIGVSSDTCAAGGGGGGGGGSSGGGSSGGGGGGGGGPSVVAAAPKSTPVVVSASVATLSPIAVSVSSVFNSDLAKGARNDDVRRLQELLAKDPSIYADGSATGFYGALTEAAVKKFQAKYSLPQVGRVGPATRAKLQEVFGSAVLTPAVPSTTPATTVAQPSPIAVSVSPVFNSNLSVGSSSSDVKRLQQLLNSDSDTRISSSGVGSPGNETNYLGSLTSQAIGKFQLKYGVVSSAGEQGYGNLGPKTRAKLQEVFGEVAAPAPAPVPPPVNPIQPVVPPATTQVAPPPSNDTIPIWMQLQPTPRAGGASVVDPMSASSPESPKTVEEKKEYAEQLPYWMQLTQ